MGRVGRCDGSDIETASWSDFIWVGDMIAAHTSGSGTALLGLPTAALEATATAH